MEELFGKCVGAIMLEKVFSVFGEGEADIPWFSDGRRNIVRSEQNRPIQEVVVQKYMTGIMEHGLSEDVASAPWMQYGPGRSLPARALTFNHRAES
eukprot:11959153-Alexandrium_andersonii.AAC.1